MTKIMASGYFGADVSYTRIMFTKLTPFTVCPSRMSRHGIIRFASMFLEFNSYKRQKAEDKKMKCFLIACLPVDFGCLLNKISPYRFLPDN